MLLLSHSKRRSWSFLPPSWYFFSNCISYSQFIPVEHGVEAAFSQKYATISRGMTHFECGICIKMYKKHQDFSITSLKSFLAFFYHLSMSFPSRTNLLLKQKCITNQKFTEIRSNLPNIIPLKIKKSD